LAICGLRDLKVGVIISFSTENNSLERRIFFGNSNDFNPRFLPIAIISSNISFSSVVGIVIPDVDTLSGWCAGQGITGEYEELCKNKDVEKLIFDDMIAIGKKRGLKSFELPKKIRLSSELFSVENEMMTPTFKSRRPQIAKRYDAEIEEMYSDLD
jgi:long-subunit acyl-CoA synthetase (AMP-forming)